MPVTAFTRQHYGKTKLFLKSSRKMTKCILNLTLTSLKPAKKAFNRVWLLVFFEKMMKTSFAIDS